MRAQGMQTVHCDEHMALTSNDARFQIAELYMQMISAH